MATGLFNLKQVNQAISQGAWSGYIAPKWVEYLVVAGGGGAGSGNSGGGGGGGGFLTGVVSVAVGTSYTVTVGSGGAGGVSGSGSTGVSSVFGSISATGGGYGGGNVTGGLGGSGGGGGGDATTVGGQGTAGQGNAGGRGANTTGTTPFVSGGGVFAGGGGGAGTIGLTYTAGPPGRSGNGGAGIASSIAGTVTTFSGGGGGGGDGRSVGGAAGTGGVGGGGNGSLLIAGGAGTANTGGGGGGGGYNPSTFYDGGAGGSGIVVVRYPGNVQFFTGGTVNYNNGYIIHIFTSSGTLAPTTPTVYNTSYQISRSLRFNSADSAYLNRTPASASNRKTWTFSAWVKRSALSTDYEVFSAGTASPYMQIFFRSATGGTADTLSVSLNASSVILTTTQVFRDVSAWYHIVAAVDTTQATSSDRIKLYVNGSQVTAFNTANYPSQNYDTNVNNTQTHAIGGFTDGTSTFSGYMTEVNFIDGQALTPSSFGATSTTNGVWAPIQYTGTYGTNGFYLNFSDNSNTTAATLGKDYSGNGNNWTPNNFSVTAGAGNDSLVDSPTSYGTDTGVGGEVRGNYATLNPLILGTTTTLANGNLDYSKTNTLAPAASFSTIGITSGKWYAEYTVASNFFFGIWGNGSSSLLTTAYPTYYWDVGANSGALAIEKSSGTSSGSGGTFAAGDIYGVAFDADAATCNFYKNNTLIFSVTGMVFSGPLFFTVGAWGGGAASGPNSMNFGQRPFAYTAPSGYKALCTQNLPTPTIGATSNTLATQFFNPVLWTGNSANPRTITGVGFQPDLVWVKRRDAGGSNFLQDAVRGVTSTDSRTLVSNTTDAETNYYTLNGGVTAFTSDGFTTSGGSTNLNINASGSTFVAWNWKANGSGSTNTAGSITSTVSANTTSGFSVVTYTGTGANATVGHGLGVALSMVIVKKRSSTGNWIVWANALTSTQYLALNLTNAVGSGATAVWNSALPTSSVFSIGTDSDVNTSGSTFVAYCFAPVAGFSAFGSYTGNNSTDGTFVFTGFRVGWVMIKCTSGGTSWIIYDAVRNTYNATTNDLIANSSNAEATSYSIDLLSNGFKIRSLTSNLNDSGLTYIYAAFASNPFKTSLAR